MQSFSFILHNNYAKLVIKEVMKVIKILCIDDDPLFLEQLINCFQNKDVRIFSYTSFPDPIPCVDACFLDIEVSHKNSIHWSKQLHNIPIIFISNHNQYVFDVVKLHVFDFIRKSHFDEEIEETIQKLFHYLYNKNNVIVFQHNNIDYRLNLMDILFVETYSHQCIIHTIDSQTFEFKKSFCDFNISIPYIIKTHHSYMINIYHCLSLHDKQAYLKNNVIIPISYRKYKKVQDSFHTMHTMSL